MSPRRRILGLAALTLCLSSLSPVAQANDREKELEEKLKETFTLTELNFVETEVRSTGCVVVLQRDDIMGSPAQTVGDVSFDPPLNTMISNGKIRQKWVGKSSRTFKSGDRFYVTKIDVDDASVYFKLISADTLQFTSVGGTTLQTRYHLLISWNFAEKAFSEVAVSDLLDEEKGIKGNLDEVFKLESEANTIQSKSVELGQTLEQVEAILGKPGKIINLGAKTVYVYSDIKVVFMDGKVSDVQ